MLNFASDYIAGAHPAVLQRLIETNAESLAGYGKDHYSETAKEKIKAACDCPDADVYFLTGGTQTNQVVIDTMLKPYQGVIAPKTGHISLHEAGAIEFTGHKIIEIGSTVGKLKAEDVEAELKAWHADENREQIVCPGMVYISFPTEYGTLYSKAELNALYDVCRSYQIPLFVDGARLGYGLCSPANDITLAELAKNCDVFSIGGTKVGALCGEAIVYTHHNMPAFFTTQVRQHGALLAKGRLLGVQFDVLFTDDLYFKISRQVIDAAEKLKTMLKEKGMQFYLDSPTNQQFIVLTDAQMETLSEKVNFGFWEKPDETHTVVRFATGWSTTDEDIEALAEIVSSL